MEARHLLFLGQVSVNDDEEKADVAMQPWSRRPCAGRVR